MRERQRAHIPTTFLLTNNNGENISYTVVEQPDYQNTIELQ